MKYTKEQIILIIQELAVQLGKTPSLSDYRNSNCKPSDVTIISYFSSWNEALVASGFKIHAYKSKEELLGLLLDYYNFYKKVPTARDIDNNKQYPNSVTYKRNFGTWNAALLLAGLKPKLTKVKNKYDKEYIINSIKEYVDKYKKIPTTAEFDADKTFPSSNTVTKYCGSWENAIKEAGYAPDIGSGFGQYTKALDGHTYRSKAEAYFVDNYLFNKYTYDIEPSYHKPEQRRKYDWYIKELATYIELDGGCRPNIVEEKRVINKKLFIRCAIIPIKSIYLNKTLNELIEDFKI